MTSADVGQAILEAVERLNGRFDGLEARFDRVETRLSAVETRLSAVETRLERVEGRQQVIEGRMAKIEQVVAELDTEIRTWPDMHYLAAAARAQMTYSRETRTDLTDLKVRMTEVFQSMATNPEVQALRDEVAQFRDQSIAIDIRLGTIEGHLGIRSEFQPG